MQNSLTRALLGWILNLYPIGTRNSMGWQYSYQNLRLMC